MSDSETTVDSKPQVTAEDRRKDFEAYFGKADDLALLEIELQEKLQHIYTAYGRGPFIYNKVVYTITKGKAKNPNKLFLKRSEAESL